MTTTDVDNWAAASRDGGSGADVERSRSSPSVSKREVAVHHDPHCDAPRTSPSRSRATRVNTLATRSIIAAGASARYFGLESREKFMGKGSPPVRLDGFFYTGSGTSPSSGGGNTAVGGALSLSNITRHVTVISARTTIQGGEDSQKTLCRRPRTSRCAGTTSATSPRRCQVESLGVRSRTSSRASSRSTSGLLSPWPHPDTGIFEGQVR